MFSTVVVSHSRALAQAAIDLAMQMVPDDPPRVLAAAGLDDGSFGTDATAIAAALDEADNPAGTLVLLDLGSALLSADMALEFVAPEVASRVMLCPAPLVEGLIATVVAASSGATLAQAAAEAIGSLQGKQEHLGTGAATQLDGEATAPTPGETDDWSELAVVVQNERGLHTRPSAAVVTLASRFDAELQLVAPGGQTARGSSVNEVLGLSLDRGDEVRLRTRGREATEALAALKALVETDLGERDARSNPEPPPEAEVPVVAAEVLEFLHLEPDWEAYAPSDSEEVRYETAMATADGFLEGLAARVPEAGTTGLVLGALRAMLHDPMVDRRVRKRISRGESAMFAVRAVMGQTIEQFEAMENDYLRERATDLRALERLLVKSLLDVDLALPPLPPNKVILLEELDALTATQLDPGQVPLVLVRATGTTGHGMIIAADRGLRVRVAGAS